MTKAMTETKSKPRGKKQSKEPVEVPATGKLTAEQLREFVRQMNKSNTDMTSGHPDVNEARMLPHLRNRPRFGRAGTTHSTTAG